MAALVQRDSPSEGPLWPEGARGFCCKSESFLLRTVTLVPAACWSRGEVCSRGAGGRGLGCGLLRNLPGGLFFPR